MGCFPCLESEEEAQLSRGNECDRTREERPMVAPRVEKLSSGDDRMKTAIDLSTKRESLGAKEGSDFSISAQTFTFSELSAATCNFRTESLLGEGGFGRVYRGRLETTGQASPMFKDRRKLPSMADPRLQGRYPMRGLYQALAVASMCIQEEAASRPAIADVVTALSYLASQAYDPGASPTNNNRPGGERRNQNADEGSGRKSSKNNNGESDHNSQMNCENTWKEKAATLRRDFDRERALAEAKMWGRNWREKTQAKDNAEGN
ncbi:hypothetical protein B296_00043262 [Ensete ventricosum]|uniref:Protein kinase domain-containing protein n=1 Tax=Ensete ventricosum TaxID=4639 RepID=A0A426Z4Q4_ENSVE|nr:hypothetical protein B296_00043262 [Ensete ventricosum]